MSTFFKALERAEHERSLRDVMPSSVVVTSAPATVEPTPVPVQPTPAPIAPPSSHFAHPPATTPERAVDLDGHHISLEEHLVSLVEPTSFAAEQYRSLRHIIEQLHRSTKLSVIAVSSPAEGDGKTTTAINLAGALAQARDVRVLLVDADLRAASMAEHLGVDEQATPGLVDAVLNPNFTLDTVVLRHPHLNLSVLMAGRRPASPYEVLISPRVAILLAAARQRYDYVIVDTPPLVPVPDGRVIRNLVDGFLLVVAAHRTPRKLLQEALNLMEPANVVGMLFNGDDRHVSRNTYSSRRRRLVRSTARSTQTASDE
jgi:capsular exopolysaccharide synthesis family protein